MKKKIPEIKTDKAAEALLEQDLTGYLNMENFQQVSFEFLPKTEKVNLRFPEKLLKAVREKSKREGISYQKYIRRAIERSLTDSRPN